MITESKKAIWQCYVYLVNTTYSWSVSAIFFTVLTVNVSQGNKWGDWCTPAVQYAMLIILLDKTASGVNCTWGGGYWANFLHFIIFMFLFIIIIKTLVTKAISHFYLAGVTTAQLLLCLENMNVIQTILYYHKKRNDLNSEINEGRFSTPTPTPCLLRTSQYMEPYRTSTYILFLWFNQIIQHVKD